MQQRYPLATSTWGEEEVAAGCDVLRSGMTTMGEKVEAFEREFAHFHDCEYAVMTNSGSSANLLMIAALVYSGRLQPGSRVAVPAVSWSTTYAPLAQLGMRVVLVDVDDSLTIDPDQIPQSVDAIFAVNLLGNPCDFDKFPKRPILIEDNCEALGAVYKGQMTGTCGLMGSHSLFFSHHISTMEGGVVTTNDEQLWRMLLMLRAHGWTRDLPEYDGLAFQAPFWFMVPGFSVRPTEVAAAIGLEQMKKLPGFLDVRRKNAAVYKAAMGYQREIESSSWFAFAILAPHRQPLLHSVSKQFEVRPIVAGNIMRHPMASWLHIEQPGSLEMADYVHNCGFMVGNHHTDCRDALQRLAALVARKVA